MVKYTLSAFATLLALFLISTPPALAHGEKIMVENAWARATLKVSKTGAAYLQIHNSGTSDDTLISVVSHIAKKTQMHNSSVVDGVMKMKKLENIKIPAGAKVSLEPGANHVMMMGMKKQLIEGEMFPLKLVFEHAGEITVKVMIMSIAAKGGMDMNHDESRGATMEMPAATTN